MLDGETSMTFEGDVYSLGMTILEAMSGMVPYAGMPGHVVLRQIMRGVHPVRLKYMPTKNEQGDRLWSLLTKCWALKPRNRPTASQVRDEIGSIASGTQ